MTMFRLCINIFVGLMVSLTLFSLDAFAVKNSPKDKVENPNQMVVQRFKWGQSSLHSKAFIEMKRKKLFVMFENNVIDDNSLVELIKQVK